MSTDAGSTPVLEISGSTTLDEYVEANRVLLLNTTAARKVRYLIYQRFSYLIGGLFSALGIATIYVVGISQATGAASSGFWAGPLTLGLGVYWLTLPGSYRRRLKKLYDQADMGRECRTKFDAEGLYSARLDGTAESRIKWEAFQFWKESSGLFVLFPSKAQYFWVPKRLLKPDEEEQLRQMLSARIPGTKGNP